MKYATSLFTLVLLSSSSAFANVPAPPSITLELCSDVDVDEVQRALAIEYWDDGDHRKTKVTVVCRGQTATLRIIGPDHPRGRIADLDLGSVDPVARPRTIALLAAELWTAPEADEAPAPARSVALQDEASPPPQPLDYHRDRFSFGWSQTKILRTARAVGSDKSFDFAGEMTSLHVEVPVSSHVKLFARYGESPDSERMEQDPNSHVAWTYGELGFYIPLWRSLLSARLRLDLSMSIGSETTEETESTGSLVHASEVMPDLRFVTEGLRLSVAPSQQVKFFAWGSLNQSHSGYLLPRVVGVEVGCGASYELGERLLLSAAGEVRALSGPSGFLDRRSSLEFAIAYLH